MSLITQISSLSTRIATEFKTIRTLISGTGTGDISGLTTTTKASLVAAINEVKATSGSVLPASATGWLHDNGAGVRAWTTPTAAQVGAEAVGVAAALVDDLSGVTNPAAARTALGLGTAATTATTAYDAAGAAAAAQAAAQTYADGLIDANNAYVYKGVIDASTNPNYPAANAGHTYKISVAGKIGGAAGVNVEVGDTITAIVDGSVAGNQATVGANWIVMQTNIDGAVVGPAASTAGDFATFSGATGKVVQDSGISLDTDATLAANSDTKLPSQKAVKAYTYSQTQLGDPTTDFVAVFTAALA